ncbi:MAG: SpoVR family protein [Pseudomonadota bacterium]
MNDVRRLVRVDEKIQQVASEMGLNFFPQEFDVIPAQKMLEIMAYRLPVNFSHWSFGRDYEMERTRYEHGFGVPYEVVLNSNPSRAYLMNTNPFAVQALVMAHVYAHNDFMKNNIHFSPTRRDMIPSASEAASRVRRYEERYGEQEVEHLMDAALAIEPNVDPDFFIKEESPEERRERLERQTPTKGKGPFEDLLRSGDLAKKPQTDLDRKTPLEPERDMILYIMDHSPKPLKDWEKDVLSVVRQQSRYFMPQRRTKVMNEGWATYWHQRIMQRLFQDGYLSAEEHGFYNLYNARVLTYSARNINPYLVGLRLFEDVEERWNKGKFGRDWDDCHFRGQREAWNTGLGKGREKIFDVRRTHTDRFFFEEFVTEKLVSDLKLYLYKAIQRRDNVDYVIAEEDWRTIKQILVRMYSDFGIPHIVVEDGDYKGRRELYLKHCFEGLPLDREYREKTLEHAYYLWQRPVHLESHEYEGDTNEQPVIMSFAGHERRLWRKLHTFDGVNHLEKYLPSDRKGRGTPVAASKPPTLMRAPKSGGTSGNKGRP